MKKLTLFILATILGGHLFGQQMPHYSLYMMNPFIYNPALAGTANYYQIRSNHRFQWAGFDGAPITNAISAYGPHKKKDMGFGATLYNDVTGPISRTGFNGIYAYNLAYNSDIRISMGVMLGGFQYKIDGTKITTYETGDNALNGTVLSKFAPDAALGVYAWSFNYYVGLSATQLFGSNLTKKFNWVDEETSYSLGLNKLKQHLYLVGGYKYNVNREWEIEAGSVMSKEIGSPFQVEIYCKGTYKNMLWGGLTFRSQDAISLLMGYTHEKKIFIGYSVDIAVTSIRKYNYGSHEIFIGFNFDKIKKVSRSSGKKK
jgi:type IX secretion system PorP/SprF family membrane protein